MNIKTKLAVAALLVSAIASPAFAAEQGSEQAFTVPANAYASAAPMQHHRATWTWSASIDRQAQGSH
jgi:hypothetical protein